MTSPFDIKSKVKVKAIRTSDNDMHFRVEVQLENGHIEYFTFEKPMTVKECALAFRTFAGSLDGNW